MGSQRKFVIEVLPPNRLYLQIKMPSAKVAAKKKSRGQENHQAWSQEDCQDQEGLQKSGEEEGRESGRKGFRSQAQVCCQEEGRQRRQEKVNCSSYSLNF